MPDHDVPSDATRFLTLPESVSVSVENRNAYINIVWYNKERDIRVELKITLHIDA